MTRTESRSLAAATWAVGGVAALLMESVVRLGTTALAGARGGFSSAEWLALALTTALLAYVEGYRGFHRSFSPRVVERAFDVARDPGLLRIVLGPLYAMALIGGSRKDRVRSWLLVVGIVAMVIIVRQLPFAWRCIVDGAVAVSLTWGLIAIVSRYWSRARIHLGASRRAANAASPRP